MLLTHVTNNICSYIYTDLPQIMLTKQATQVVHSNTFTKPSFRAPIAQPLYPRNYPIWIYEPFFFEFLGPRGYGVVVSVLLTL